VLDKLLNGTYVPSSTISRHDQNIRSTESSAMSVRDALRERFATLSPALQQIAKFVLDHPNQVVTTSMRNVGSDADAPPSTLVRFAQSFGFDGWPQFKEALAQDMGLGPESPARYGEKARTLIGRAGDQGLTRELFETHRANLEATESRSAAAIHRAAALLAKAGAVHAAGFRACYPLAFQFVYVYRLFRNSVHLVDGQGGTLEMQQRLFAKGDAVLVASFEPYSALTVQVAEAAKAAGCGIVALTDSAASPLALVADVTLLFAVESPSFFPSITGGMALTESLLEVLATEAGKPAVKRIERAEAQLSETGAYVRTARRRKE
jgi:DNA-binding MurR/RpiR family transcriptional regulator